jgi:nitrate reductase NapE component
VFHKGGKSFAALFLCHNVYSFLKKKREGETLALFCCVVVTVYPFLGVTVLGFGLVVLEPLL